MTGSWTYFVFVFDVTLMTIQTFIKQLYCFIDVLVPTYTTFQKVKWVVGFAVDIAKDCIFSPTPSSPSDPAVELCCFHVFASHAESIPLHCPIPGLLVDISALTKRSFKLLGFLKTATGGFWKILCKFWCSCIIGQCSLMVLATLPNAGWYARTKGTRLFSFF